MRVVVHGAGCSAYVLLRGLPPQPPVEVLPIQQCTGLVCLPPGARDAKVSPPSQRLRPTSAAVADCRLRKSSSTRSPHAGRCGAQVVSMASAMVELVGACGESLLVANDIQVRG